MTRRLLAAEMVADPLNHGVAQAEAERQFDAFVAAARAILLRGGFVVLPGIGKLCVTKKKAQIHHAYADKSKAPLQRRVVTLKNGAELGYVERT